MKASVLVIGESLVDIVETTDGSHEWPGGSSLNVAVGLARLGRTVELGTRIGMDSRGDAVRAVLAEAGVHVGPDSIRHGRTSTAHARIGQEGSADYEFDVDWTFSRSSASQQAQVVHTGSLGAFVEPGGTAVAAFMTEVASGPLITFDPNVRPALMGTHRAALSRFREIAQVSTLVKMSDEDAAWLYPGRSVDGVIDLVLRHGATAVVVTRGAKGALLASREVRVEVPARRVSVADTVGAGDSFTAALIARLTDLLDAGMEPEVLRDGSVLTRDRLGDMGAFAALCAAITCSRSGANPPTLGEALADDGTGHR
jgi:fructokinase